MKMLICFFGIILPIFAYSQLSVKIADFSPNYALSIQIPESDRDEVFRRAWISLYETASNTELIHLSTEELAFELPANSASKKSILLPYSAQQILYYVDVNFDGLMDLAIQDGQNSCYHGPSYQVYLGDGQGFHHSPDFTRLAQEYCGMFEVNTEQKELHTWTKSGCCWHEYTTFKIESNRPKAIQIVEVDGSGYPFVHTTTIVEDGSESIENKLDLDYGGIQQGISFQLSKNKKTAYLFVMEGQNLHYVLNDTQNQVEFSFPENGAPIREFDFEYRAFPNRASIIFSNSSAEYEIYQNETNGAISSIGILVRFNGKTYDLKGDPESLKGNLRKFKGMRLENVQQP